jgi:hypothetical protein
MPETSDWKVEARDLQSIGTLHARAFHPTREWNRKVFPSSIAPWWEEKYALDIDDPDCHLLKIPAPESSTTVLGLLSLRKFKADERGAGRWSSLPPPPGRGFGTRLLARACEIADQEKLCVFVQANEFAESFYRKFGFKTEQKLEMPGGLTECFLIRYNMC